MLIFRIPYIMKPQLCFNMYFTDLLTTKLYLRIASTV